MSEEFMVAVIIAKVWLVWDANQIIARYIVNWSWKSFFPMIILVTIGNFLFIRYVLT